jgi:proteasome lid subunit RPN8/RPN11
VRFEPANIDMQSDLLQSLEVHTRSFPDAEVCGLIFGNTYYPLKNLSRNPFCFESDPAELARALAKHGEPLAIYHSHPNGMLAPSEADCAKAYYPRSKFVIGTICDGDFQIRCFVSYL